MKNLEGKRILFIEPNFFNYGSKIKMELENQGACVDSISYFKDSAFYRISRYFPEIEKKLINNRVEKQFQKIAHNQYDYIFAIRGGKITKDNFDKIKKSNPNAKSILYLWDSVKENPYITSILPCFNSIFSFDPQDCQKYNFNYLPLFYIRDFYRTKSTANEKFKYDIVFVGRDHSDRFNILKKYQEQAEKSGISIFFHLYTTRLGYLKRKILNAKDYRNIKKEDFKFDILSYEQIGKIYDQAKCVLDIELSVQSGLTMRTFELLAARKKMITTNASIKDFELFSASNMHIINREDPKLNLDFIKTDFVFDERIRNYSIENWVKNIFILAI